ncbi:MAG TPA: acetolactate synthase large subunit [Acidimicrobiales bacterium]|nr:acetolactate synthase large subunit [Acidimicrobiales bacterium]
MNGAGALIRTLSAAGVEVCFANPGTSEMHFVAAVDDVPEMRSILGLFEGVVTGAADGYARMADKPAATLLHLGSGLGNGLANLHNARRAASPLVNIVGDHATYHAQYDAPLQSDIETVAKNCSGWIGRPESPVEVGPVAAAAVAAATGPPGQVATLILPADASWGEGAEPAAPVAPTPRSRVDEATIDAVAGALRSGEKTVVLVGGSVLRGDGLRAANRIATATGAQVLGETFPARLERGAGVPALDRLQYLAEFAAMQLDGAKHLVLADAKSPVSFFAYPDKPSDLVPDGCEVHTLAGGSDDAVAALEAVAELVATDVEPTVPALARPDLPTGALTAEMVAAAVGALLPDDCIVVDESNTSGLWAPGATAGCPPHDWLTLTGGAIGIGLPLATGAAVGGGGRPVVCLGSDGSSMYTFQALWTQAREALDVTTIIFNNSSYAVLNLELSRVGAGEPGPKALDMLDLTRPDLDFVALAKGCGVDDAVRVTTGEEMADALGRALASPGPSVIEAVVPRAI